MPHDHRQRHPDVSLAEQMPRRPRRRIVMKAGPLHVRPVPLRRRIVDRHHNPRLILQRLIQHQQEQPPTQRLGEFSAPLSHLATKFVETWEFVRVEGGTNVAWSFEMHAKLMATRPVLWLISFFVKRAIARHLQEIRSQ